MKMADMAAIAFVLLNFMLGVHLSGQQENAGPTVDEDVRAAVNRAVLWMHGQRRDDSSWGPFTPRAIVALSLAQVVAPLPEDERTIMKKQLNILLSLELNRNLTSKDMGLSRLALYVNALYATCQDPRNFHGLDLVQILRSRSDIAQANVSDFSLPVVFISLCLAQDVRYKDVRAIIQMYSSHRNKTDLQALSLLGLRCIANQNSSSSLRQHVDSLVANFHQHFNSMAPSADVNTLALAMQVLRGDVKLLIAKQSSDGSFGSLLGTYYAIPALLGTTVFNTRCSKKRPLADSSMSYPLSDPSSSKVFYSVWLGEGDDRDVHTVTLTLATNRTFFDLMRVAQGRNANFRFNYEERNGIQHVYSIGGTPNDVQRELSWILYQTKGDPNGFHPKRALHEITMGVNQFHPAPEDHFIFWFRRHSLRV